MKQPLILASVSIKLHFRFDFDAVEEWKRSLLIFWWLISTDRAEWMKIWWFVHSSMCHILTCQENVCFNTSSDFPVSLIFSLKNKIRGLVWWILIGIINGLAVFMHGLAIHNISLKIKLRQALVLNCSESVVEWVFWYTHARTDSDIFYTDLWMFLKYICKLLSDLFQIEIEFWLGRINPKQQLSMKHLQKWLHVQWHYCEFLQNPELHISTDRFLVLVEAPEAS